MKTNDTPISVLLVEDETTLAMIIKDTLEGQGFSIHTAGDGEEGLRRCHELHPDVIVADVMMPRMDGFEMVRRLRQSDRQTPVLFLTARSAVNDVVQGFELGANDYLKKPFGMQELIVRIKALVGRAYLAPAGQRTEQQTRFNIGNYQLDSIAQKKISDALNSLRCTRIVIAHRLSTIRQCDRIVVLDHGRIIEDGTYDADTGLTELEDIYAYQEQLHALKLANGWKFGVD